LNRRPHACKARALPAELWPLNRFGPSAYATLRRDGTEPKLVERRLVRLRARFGATAFARGRCAEPKLDRAKAGGPGKT